MRTVLTIGCALGLLASPRALACGQSTHVYIGQHAISHLPEGSDLRAIMDSDAYRDLVINGAMFPDGGYSPLANDAYGEIAHWEPFQWSYLQWVQETFPEDRCSDEALGHAVLALGMASHGIADQVYDGLYLERSLLIEPDAWGAGGNVDAATDVAFAAAVGPQSVPEDVLDYDTLASLFTRVGHEVDASTILAGQTSLQLAVGATSGLGQDPDAVQRNIDAFPWATTHLTDDSFPGAPICIGEVVAEYWQAQWDRLHDRFDDATQWVVWTWPRDGATGVETDPASIDSQVALLFGKTVDIEDVDAADLTWRAEDDTEIPFSRRMYYGNASNVLLLRPQAPLADDTQYTLTLGAGMGAHDGSVLSTDVSWTFTTGTHGGEPDDDIATDGPGQGGAAAPPSLLAHPPACPDRVPDSADTDTDATASCGCTHGPAGGGALALLTLGALSARRRARSVRPADPAATAG